MADPADRTLSIEDDRPDIADESDDMKPEGMLTDYPEPTHENAEGRL
jgi:hypothetical protein